MSPKTELIASTAVTADAAVSGGTGTEEVVTQEEEREDVLEEMDDEVVILEEEIRLIHRDISSASTKREAPIKFLPIEY